MGRLAAYHQADAGVYYDADLQRFVYHGDHMVAAYLPSDHNGNAWTDAQWEAIWGPGQDQLLTFFDHTHATGTRVLNVMRDHRNSVVGAYDADTDHVVGRAHYNADGRMMTFDTDAAAYATSDIQSVDCQEVGTFDGICEAPGGIPFAFNSMWRSPATGMVYMRNRVYDPRLGQFLSHDPLGYIASFNLYQFANFDPVNFWDPKGLNPWVAGAIALGAGLIVDSLLDDTPDAYPRGSWQDRAGVVHPSWLQVDAFLPDFGAGVGASMGIVGLKKVFKDFNMNVGDDVLEKMLNDFGGDALGKLSKEELQQLSEKTAKELAGDGAKEGGEEVAEEGVEKVADKSLAEGSEEASESASKKAETPDEKPDKKKKLKAKERRALDKKRTEAQKGQREELAPRWNQPQNEQFSALTKELGLDKDQADRLHRAISKRGYNREEIKDIAKSMFDLE